MRLDSHLLNRHRSPRPSIGWSDSRDPAKRHVGCWLVSLQRFRAPFLFWVDLCKVALSSCAEAERQQASTLETTYTYQSCQYTASQRDLSGPRGGVQLLCASLLGRCFRCTTLRKECSDTELSAIPVLVRHFQSSRTFLKPLEPRHLNYPAQVHGSDLTTSELDGIISLAYHSSRYMSIEPCKGYDNCHA